MVLRTAVSVVLRSAELQAHIRRHGVVGANLLGELAVGVVLAEAANVAIESLAVGVERSALLRNRLAVEGDVHLSEHEVVEVESPGDIASVGVSVPLRLGRSAEHVGLRDLSRVEADTLTQLRRRPGRDDSADTKRRLRDGDAQRKRARRRAVAETQLEALLRVLQNVAEAERRLLVPGDPAGPVGLLPLKDSDGRGAGAGSDADDGVSAAGGHDAVGSEVSNFGGVKDHRHSPLRLGVHGRRREVGKAKVADLAGASSPRSAVAASLARRRGGLNKGALGSNKRELDALDSKSSLAQVGNHDVLRRRPRAERNLREADAAGLNEQQRT